MAPAAAAPGGAVTPADLIGSWTGIVTHAGASTPIGVELEAADSGRVVAKLSLPVIHAHGYPAGRVRVSGDSVRFGPFALAYDSAAGRLAGVVPAALLPVHEAPFELKRGPLERVARPALEAPVVEPAWTFDAGAPVWADVGFAGRTVFVGDDAGRLVALDAKTGKPRWTFTAGGAIRARPVVEGDDLYVQADDGLLYKLSARRGSLRWKVPTTDSAIVRLPFDRPGSRFDARASAVHVASRRLYVGTHDGRVLALDAATGARAWSFATGGPVLAAPRLAGGTVYAGSFDGRVYALDAASGGERWRHDLGAPVSSTPVETGGIVIAGSRSYDLIGLDAATGAVAWSRYLWFSWIESTPTIRDGMAYLGSSDAAKAMAIDARTGRSVWEADVHGIAWGQPAVTAELVVVGTQGAPYVIAHHAHVLALDRATGRASWRFPIEPPAAGGQHGFAGSAALGDGRVYLAASDGRVFAFDLAERR